MAAKGYRTGTDWKAVCRAYIDGQMTLEELAQSHDLNPWTVRAQAKKGKWCDLRRAARVNAAAGQTKAIDALWDALLSAVDDRLAQGGLSIRDLQAAMRIIQAGTKARKNFQKIPREPYTGPSYDFADLFPDSFLGKMEMPLPELTDKIKAESVQENNPKEKKRK